MPETIEFFEFALLIVYFDVILFVIWIMQEMLFRMACLPMVENCLSGYNSCMFAYGQVSSKYSFLHNCILII